jgi:hypothetical protein
MVPGEAHLGREDSKRVVCGPGRCYLVLGHDYLQ